MKRENQKFGLALLAHRNSLLSFGSKLTKSKVDAEDLVQDTMVKALQCQHQFKPGTNLGAWLMTMMKHTWFNQRQHESLKYKLFEKHGTHSLFRQCVGEHSTRATFDPNATAEAILKSEVREAVDSLPHPFSQAVRLVELEEHIYHEAAKKMGCPIGSIMSRLHRGRKLLAEKWAA